MSVTIDLSTVVRLNDEQFYQLCRANPEVKFERNLLGEIVIVSPTGGETGKRNVEIAADFVIWNRKAQLGFVFDSSTCFRLPIGSSRSPDVAWVKRDRWLALTPEERQKFPPLCPDFVLELRSSTDALKPLQEKMQEYVRAGIRLGWLLNPADGQVEVYGPAGVEMLEWPGSLLGESVLPGFELELAWLWSGS
ncbi:MAG: Uma2 family endonuclease [Elainellaceae cyanobacterium]